jgi:hypothetical protein
MLAPPAGGQPATIVCTPATLTFQYRAGDSDPAAQTVSVQSNVAYTIDLYSDPLTTSPGGWLSVSRTSNQLTVNARPRGYSPRTYAGRIVLKPQAPYSSPVTINVSLVVTLSPQLAASPASLRFSDETWRSVPWIETITTSCSGATALDWTATATAVSWLSLPKPRGTAGAPKPGAESETFSQNLLPLSIDPTGLTPGEYSTAVTITAPGAGNSPVTIPVTLVVPPPPSLKLQPDSIELEAAAGSGPISRLLEITDSGLPLTYAASARSSTNWLSVTPDRGKTPGTLTITLNAAGLAVGTYQGAIEFSVAGTSRAQFVPVLLTVKPPSPTVTAEEKSIVNAATFLPEISSGSWFTIFGSGLSNSIRIWTASDFVGDRMPLSLGDVSVTVNDRPAAVQVYQPSAD